MTKEFAYLMRLCGNAAHGKTTANNSKDIDWKKLVALSRQQMIHPLLGYALKISQGLNCPQRVLQACIQDMQMSSAVNCLRCSEILAILQEMEKAGISYALLKGFDAAQNYAMPCVRVSGDTDVLVELQHKKRAMLFLRSKGFVFDRHNAESHHTVSQHPTLGCLELHTGLYDKFIETYWFHTTHPLIREPHKTVTSEYGDYVALGTTDNLLFQTLHMVKHFIRSGASLRAMLDISLFYEKNYASIDKQRYWSTLHSLKYDMLISTVYRAAERFCGFPQELFKEIPHATDEQITLFLDDLEMGGWLGRNWMERSMNSWREYNHIIMRQEHSEKAYRRIMYRRQVRSLVSMLFPPKHTLATRYPFVIKKGWLVPFAWMHRTFIRGPRLLRKGILGHEIVSLPYEISKNENDRVQLFKKMDMIE